MKAVFCLALLAALLTACTGGGPKHSSTSATPPATSAAASPATLPPAQASVIDAALGDGSPAKVETVLEPTVRSAYAKAPTSLLPAGSTVKVDASSMKIAGTRAAVTAVVTTAGKPKAYTLYLTQVAGKWLIYGTSR